MIAFLRGKLVAKQPPVLVLEVQGVGYELEAPMTTFYDLPELGQEVTLHTHLQVREDAHTLFAFARTVERSLFRTLIKINGVGAKMALAILSGMTADHFVECVQSGDVAALTRVPGVGKKTAERLIVELRDRLNDFAGGSQTGGAPVAGAPAATPADAVEEAVSALVALGYKPQEASRMVRAVDAADLPSEQIIRLALQGAVK